MPEKNTAAGYIEEAVRSVSKLEPGMADEITGVIMESLRNGGKVMVCGNGGSAADGSHFAGELVGRFRRERRGMPAMALSADTAVATAIANDYGFERMFERQVEALGTSGDVLVVLSTSGTSRNVVRAAQKASSMGIVVIAFTSGACARADWADLHWKAPSMETSHAQEQMMIVLHGICHGLEALLEKES